MRAQIHDFLMNLNLDSLVFRQGRKHRSKCGVVCFLAVAALLFLAGCGGADSDFYVVAKDARGVAAGAPVIWQVKKVGKVKQVQTVAGGVRIDAVLDEPFRGTVRVGAKACPLPVSSSLSTPALYLVGGSDVSMPALARGAAVPEASLVETGSGHAAGFLSWLGSSGQGMRALVLIVAGLVVFFIAWKLLKGLVKVVLFAAAIALVAFAVWGVKNGWDVQRFSSIVTGDVKTWVEEHKQWLTEHAQQIFKK